MPGTPAQPHTPRVRYGNTIAETLCRGFVNCFGCGMIVTER